MFLMFMSNYREVSADEIVKAFTKIMIGNIISGDFYGFLEPFAPIIDGEEFTQQQVDAFSVSALHVKIIN